MGKVFPETNAIYKREKIELPDWHKMKVIPKGFQTVKDLIEFYKDS